MNSIPDLILASNSPRREHLLKELGYDFEIRTVPVEEDWPEELLATEVAEYLACKKNAVNRQAAQDHEVILTADTVVIRDQDILNKPADEQEAFDMIDSLSGRPHDVITGVCISGNRDYKSFSVKTTVYFAELSKEEIRHYIVTAKPFDKAGAYGIQEWIGLIGVTKIEGSFFNVVGLPTREVHEALQAIIRG